MKRYIGTLFGVLSLVVVSQAFSAQTWTEGTHYTLLSPAQHTNVPAGKVEVMEVFSYGCIACNGFQPMMKKLITALPKNAQLVFLPASFLPEEDWSMFQRAYFTAQSLGVAERTHQAIFDAVWKSGELAISDPLTHRLKRPMPSIEDAARCYSRIAGVRPEDFLAAAHSLAVDVKMKAADEQVTAMQVPGTPCIVVNGKYRLHLESVNSEEEFIELVKFLVAKEKGA